MTGNLLIIAAPSGAGKTTLVKALLAHDPRVQLSISYTTRAPRPGEENEREYHFVKVSTFTAMREQGEFLESALVHGNWYGTARGGLERQMANGQDVVLEIDWQGARQVRKIFPRAMGVFILPPSMQELEQRLRNRAQDTEEAIQQRLANAQEELKHVSEFEHVIINNQLSNALTDLLAVTHALRLRYAEQRMRYISFFSHFDKD